MYTKRRGADKYKDNQSALMAEAVHRATLKGCAKEAGDVDADGQWLGLVLGRRYGFIVTEDSQGNIDVADFESHDEARRTFAARATAIENVRGYRPDPEDDGLTLADEIDAGYHQTE